MNLGSYSLKLSRISLPRGEPVEHKYDVSLLKDLIREHVELTGSPRGKEILDNFGEYLPKFKKVLPHDYDKMLGLLLVGVQRDVKLVKIPDALLGRQL